MPTKRYNWLEQNHRRQAACWCLQKELLENGTGHVGHLGEAGRQRRFFVRSASLRYRGTLRVRDEDASDYRDRTGLGTPRAP